MNRGKQSFAGLATILAGAYLLLAVLSVACAVEHSESRPSGHHHGGTLSHSSFCAWACQANPACNTGPSALALQPFLTLWLSVERSPAAVPSGELFSAASRAPPVQS